MYNATKHLLTDIARCVTAKLTFKITRNLLIFSICLCVPAQAQHIKLPPDSTKEQVQREIDHLKGEKQAVDRLIDQAGAKIFSSGFDSLTHFVNGTLGPLFGRSEDFDKIAQTVNEADIAARSGHGAIAASKTKEAIKLASELLKQDAQIMTGEVDPNELLKRFWASRKDLGEGANAGADLARAMEQSEILIQIKHSYNTQIAQLEDQRKSAPSFQKSHPAKQSARKEGGTTDNSGASNGFSSDPELIDVINCTESGTLDFYSRGGKNCSELMKNVAGEDDGLQEISANGVKPDATTSADCNGGLRNFSGLSQRIAKGSLPPETITNTNIEFSDCKPKDKSEIPPGWVACQCPAAHPGLGAFFNGVQYHDPSFHCP